MEISQAYYWLFSGAMIWLALLIGAMLIRSIIGPRITDRILSINMIGTLVVACILILTVFLGEPYLLDVALIYVMISFVVVQVLAMTYIPSHKKRERQPDEAEIRELEERHHNGSTPGKEKL